jgi:hypothetical protein
LLAALPDRVRLPQEQPGGLASRRSSPTERRPNPQWGFALTSFYSPAFPLKLMEVYIPYHNHVNAYGE